MQFIIVLFLSAILFFACKQEQQHGSPEHVKKVTVSIDDARLINADSTPGDWLSNGKNYAENRYSTLEQINKENIKDLGLAWSCNLETNKG